MEKKRKRILNASIRVIVCVAIVLICSTWLSSVVDVVNRTPVVENVQTESEQINTEETTETEEVTGTQNPPPDSMQIIMIGDMLMHDKLIKSGEQETGGYNFDHIFTNVKDYVLEADLAILNQETIMGGADFGYSGYPCFNTPNELIDAEVIAGFDVLLFATNHAYDKGQKGIQNCMEYLDTTHPSLGYVGINHNKEDSETIYTYESNGITVAILNYTYGLNGVTLSKDKKYLVNELDEEKVRSDIRKAKEIADFVIVCPHWGTELKLTIDKSQEKWTNVFLEEGVDLVLGTHPHVIEPVEWITDENGHQMLVYYSLGNFINGTSSTGHGVSNRMLGFMADVLIERNEETGEVEIVTYDAIPVVCHVAEKTEYTVYFLKDYTEELASQNLILNQDSEFTKNLCESLVDQVLGE